MRKYKKEHKSRFSLIFLLIFWLGIGAGMQEARADEFSEIMGALEAIVAADQTSAIDLGFIKGYDLLISQATADQLTKTIEQMGIDAEHWTALTSAYGMSDPTSHSFSFDEGGDGYTELWSADDWDDAIKEASGGNSSRYEELKAAYKVDNPTLLDHQAGEIDSDALVKSSYSQKAKVVNAALAVSHRSYDDINERIRNFQELMNNIDDVDKNKNEKAAIDLNSRLIAEVGLIQLEMLRLQSIQAQVQASDEQDAINHDTIEKQLLGYNVN